MEPRKAGRYSGKDILLAPDKVKLLDRFMIERNKTRKYLSYPVIQFPGHYQRIIGCLGSGNRFLYIDPAGNFHSCPFCRKSLGNALIDSIDSGIEKARSSGCHMFKQQVL
jgi:MoaA/NifB/PqqE/SkfB family radical SAM enzyme